MKKRFFAVLLCVLTVITAIFVFSACGKDSKLEYGKKYVDYYSSYVEKQYFIFNKDGTGEYGYIDGRDSVTFKYIADGDKLHCYDFGDGLSTKVIFVADGVIYLYLTGGDGVRHLFLEDYAPEDSAS